MGDTVTAEIVKRRDRGLLDKSLNIRGVAFTNGESILNMQSFDLLNGHSGQGSTDDHLLDQSENG